MTAINDGAQKLNSGLATKRDARVDFEGALATGLKSVLWGDGFNLAAVNSANYKNPVTTQTVGFANGYATLNGSGITTANSNSAKQTYRVFPLAGSNELKVEIVAFRNNAPQINETLEFGLFNAVLPGAAAPTDGVLFRFATDGAGVPRLFAVVNFNGTESTAVIAAVPAANKVHRWGINVVEREVEFWVDGVLVQQILINTLANTFAAPFASTAVPFTARYIIGATPPATVTQFMMSAVNSDMAAAGRESPWADQLAGAGQFLHQGQNGGTMGSTAAYANNAAPAAAALTNTTALVTGLGGQAHILPTLAAGTDGIVFDFVNPVGGVQQTPRSLVIKGVRLHSVVDVILAGGPVIYAWSLAFGHTAVSMATAENAATGTKAPRRVPIGLEIFAATAAVGSVGTPAGLEIKFVTPIVVNPGERVALIAKNIGTVTATGDITTLAAFDGYFE